jgi:hypothetical protein
MPNIMVVADTASGGDAVFLAERLTTEQLDDAHCAAQLVERLKWAGARAVGDPSDGRGGVRRTGRRCGGCAYAASRVVEDFSERERACRLLREKHPQFEDAPSDEGEGPVIAVDVEEWAGWAYSS